MNKIRLFSVLILPFIVGITVFSHPGFASVNTSKDALDLIHSSCPSDFKQNKELNRLNRQITGAGSLAEARRLALAPTDDAIAALKRAQTLAPFSDDIRVAGTKLDEARSRILLASSQQQVADAFNGMMLAGLDDDSAARVSAGDSGCNYSTGEIIAIVVGLILGIIPGIILLFVLC